MIVLAVHTVDGAMIVTVAPITHARPEREDAAIEIPPATKARLGLDGARSWVIADDLNQFVWPGADLRPIRRGASTFAYGLLPAALYRQVRERVLRLARAGRAAVTGRQG